MAAPHHEEDPISDICLCIALIALLVGCSKQETFDSKVEIPPADSAGMENEARSFQTLEEGVKWYLQEIEPHKYTEGDEFLYAYRIVDIPESSDVTIVNILAFCTWIDLAGEPVSDNLCPIAFTFKADSKGYTLLEVTGYADNGCVQEWPQNILDAYEEENRTGELRSKVEQEIAGYLAGNS